MFQDRLDQVGGLLGRLQNAQNQRLSAPLPQHLSQIPHPSPQEIQLGIVNIKFSYPSVLKIMVISIYSG